MTPPPDDEPLSFLRCVEFALAVLALAMLVGGWVYSWLRGSLLVALWYGVWG